MYEQLKGSFSYVFKGDKTFETAIEKAYADMSRRATGHKAEMKERCINWIVNEKVFCEALNCTNQEEFDNWHRKTCGGLKEIHGEFGSVGRSQKFINMAFKYLACVDNTFDDILKFCHMTLDKYTFNWYKSIGGKWQEWSKMDDYKEYLQIQKVIRKHLSENRSYSIRINNATTKPITLPKTPFEAEFIVWKGEIINEKYNNLTKSLKMYITEDKQNDEWLIGGLFDEVLRFYSKKL